MKKIFLSFLLAIFTLSSASMGICDTVNTKQISTSGKITYLVSGLIEIKTSEGEKKIWRKASNDSYRDIITFGIFHSKRVSGEVFFVDEKTAEVRTHNGDIKIPRWKIKDISLSDYWNSIYINKKAVVS